MWNRVTITFALGLLILTGCKSQSLEDLAKDAAQALNTGNFARMIEIGEKVSKMSEADQERFEKLVEAEMEKIMPDLVKDGGGIFKDLDKDDDDDDE